MPQKRKEITSHREVERIVHIHEQIAAGKYPNTTKLADTLECSTSTISRDLEFLRDRCYAPYEYDSTKRGFYYTDPNFQLKFGTLEKAIDAEIADEKKSFAEYMNLEMSVLDKVEEITELNLPSQTVLQANLTNKYIGRNYFDDGCTWLGLKYFDYAEKLLFTLAHFEDYKSNPKSISFKLQGTKLNYISEFNAYDNGYWHYIILDQNLFDTKTEVARMELKNLIAFTRGELSDK